jgi:hypothetical protein
LDGRLLGVGVLLKPDSVQALREHMTDHIASLWRGEDHESWSKWRESILAGLMKRNLLDAGVYAEGGTLYINLNTFPLSCADGSFHPIPIPRKLIKPDLIGKLR